MGLFDQFFGKKKTTIPEPKVESRVEVLSDSRIEKLREQCPFPVSSVSGANVEAELLRLRTSLAPTGSTPVILGKFDDALLVFDLWDEPYDLGAELDRAEKLDVEKWIAERREDDTQAREDEKLLEVHPRGISPMYQLSVGHDYKGNAHAEVFIATLPTADSTLIPLHLRFGGWNACPSSHVHTAMARYWKAKYGAEIATLAGAVLEFTVAHPPSAAEQAMELAWQQFFYCDDIVYQGVGSVATLAESLKGSTRWFFWWD